MKRTRTRYLATLILTQGLLFLMASQQLASQPPCGQRAVSCTPNCPEQPFGNSYYFIDVRTAEMAGLAVVYGPCGSVYCLIFTGTDTIQAMKCFSTRFDVDVNDCTGWEYTTQITLCCGNPAYTNQCGSP